MTAVDPRVVMDKLGGFAHEDELAAFLLDERCSGTRGAGRVCPVARYLTRETGAAVMVGQGSWSPDYVMATLVRYTTKGVYGGPTICNPTFLPLPPVVSRMIVKFDHGGYPALEDPQRPKW